jgi:undecaprenyl phosphate N,N'-diacetylbacillosamine 1-phosphate transferase
MSKIRFKLHIGSIYVYISSYHLLIMIYRTYFKKPLDLIVAFTLLIATSPLIILIFILLLFENQGQPIFFQDRLGKNQKSFKIIKFKTMNDKKDQDGKLLPDIERLTSIGHFLRKLSLDELPQLINVLKGDMSIIGPRPLIVIYADLFNPLQNQRHQVRPGITGWAQINGRNKISWTKKFELDVEYVQKINFNLDVKIFWLTIIKIINRDGINKSELEIVEPFDGNN